MNSLRGDKNIKLCNNNVDINFQILEWLSSNELDLDENEESSNSDSSDSEENKKFNFKDNKTYVIRMYGVTNNGTSISVNIHGFPPHYYVSIPNNWQRKQVNLFVNYLKSQIKPKFFKDSIISHTVVMKKKFWGFTNNKICKFIRLYFKNTEAMNACIRLLNKKLRVPSLNKIPIKYDLYESNITPFIRFIHIRELLPAGWINLKAGKYTVNNNNSNCQIDVDVRWKNIDMFETDDMAPFQIASFDIEADSSHGDFPLAKKKYKKLATDVLDNYKKVLENIKKYRNIDRKKSLALKEKIINPINYIGDLIKLGFIDSPNNENINYVYTKFNLKPNFKYLEKISKKVLYYIENPESYKVLAKDIIHNFNFDLLDNDDKSNIDDILDDDELIQTLIDDAFTEDINVENKTVSNITKVYTKTNIKPTKRIIEKVSKITMKIYIKLFKQLLNYFDNIKDVHYIISNYDGIIESNSDVISKIDLDSDKLQDIIKLIDLSLIHIVSKLTEFLPELDISRDIKIQKIMVLFDKCFPAIEGDKVIQIGTVVQKYGDKLPCIKHMITLDTCEPIEGCHVESYKTEREVLIAWAKFIKKLDPDIITGYNIFGFDFSYMYHRAEELNCVDEFSMLGRIKGLPSVLENKKLASSALGENVLSYLTMHGRIQMDLFKIIQKDHNLVSYKLDYVAETFIKDNIMKIENEGKISKLEIKGAINLNIGNFITIHYIDGEGEECKFLDGAKIKILDIKEDIIILEKNVESELENKKATWRLAKDDVSPQDIFRLQKGTAKDRKKVAVYCIQDCALCLHIINKLDIITNNIGMANVCSVPLSYLFLRGQGVKIFSLVSKRCAKDNFLIPTIKHKKEETRIKHAGSFNAPKYEYSIDDEDITGDNDGGYEGAIVLKPTPGIYLETPVTVLDYASLYPSSMISENLSHDSIVLDKKYMGDNGAEEIKKLGYDFVDITHDVYKWIDPNILSKGKQKVGKKTCRFVQFGDEKGVIPRILQFLLKARKSTRAKIKTESDPFKKSVLDGLQLAYKITANSLYGQIGARTSPIYLKDIAASTTATGRDLLERASRKVQEYIPGTDVVYGDTDSIFVNFNAKDENGNKLKGKEALKKSIELGEQFEKKFRSDLKAPHNLEYEKTFWPFILLSKKRYVGNKYEFDINKYKPTSMGIVLKRRDNANIVKYVYGGIINIIMNEKDINKAIRFMKTSLQDLLDGKFGMDMLVITKSLRGYYKNPDSIAHKVLADRMAERDPGNKPKSNDRIPYVYIEYPEKKGVKILQGDRVEHPTYILENKLKPDYKFYITNQIKKPVSQVFGLIVQTLEGYNKPKDYFENKYKKYRKLYSVDKSKAKVTDLKNEEAAEILFGDIIRQAQNKKNKVREITHYFKPSK